MQFRFDNTYARDLPGLSVPWKPAPAPAPRLLFLNHALAAELGLDTQALSGPAAAALFAGNTPPEGAEPIAQAYAGHQFGGFSPRLGDGRALLLGEVIDRAGRRRDIAFKGSGRTPFSRGGDGKAAVGPMLREVLVGEAMHALGIPTTRALAVAATGESVRREQPLPGAVLTRVAASHLRVGTFQFALAGGDITQLRRLADYTITRHAPELVGMPEPSFAGPPQERLHPLGGPGEARVGGDYLGLMRSVAARQANLIAQWMNVGFIHGVMNTDNMAISGETIDYGPCAFMEGYDPAAVFSSIDHGGRYAYGQQPGIAQWNLARFAETLLPLMAEDGNEAAMQRAVDQAMEVLHAFPGLYSAALRTGQRAKLGLLAGKAADDGADGALADDFLDLLRAQSVDFTLAWRRLADAADGNDVALLGLFADPGALQGWLLRWRARCTLDEAAGGPAGPQRAARMRGVSPWVTARNHRVEEALAAASDGDDLGPFERLLAALRRPYEETPDLAYYAEPAAAHITARYQTFCGT